MNFVMDSAMPPKAATVTVLMSYETNVYSPCHLVLSISRLCANAITAHDKCVRGYTCGTHSHSPPTMTCIAAVAAFNHSFKTMSWEVVAYREHKLFCCGDGEK